MSYCTLNRTVKAGHCPSGPLVIISHLWFRFPKQSVVRGSPVEVLGAHMLRGYNLYLHGLWLPFPNAILRLAPPIGMSFWSVHAKYSAVVTENIWHKELCLLAKDFVVLSQTLDLIFF